MTQLAAMLLDGPSSIEIIRDAIDVQKRKKHSGYFLVRLQKEAQEQKVLKRRGITSKWRL